MRKFPSSTVSSSLDSVVALASAQCDSFRDGSVTGGVTWGLCTVLTKLFIPDQRYIQDFVDLRDEVALKPPFGYVSVFMDEFETLTVASSTTSTQLSTVSGSGELQLFNWAQLSIFGIVRTIFSWFIWLLVVYYVVVRFRDFSLHG